MGLAESLTGLQQPLALIAAPFVGSFLGLVSTRLLNGGAIVFGRSHCDACGRTLAIADLVPMLSWILLRGRCRSCGESVEVLYPMIELAALAVAAWAALKTEGAIFLVTCGLGWTLLTLAAIDMRSFLLPDRLTLPLAAAGLAVTFALDPAEIADHLLGAGAGYASFALLRAVYAAWRGREGLGMGDAKLMAAAGAWLSWQALPAVVTIAALGGLLAVAVGLLAGRPREPGDRIAFGPCICLGMWIVWLYGTPVLA